MNKYFSFLIGALLLSGCGYFLKQTKKASPEAMTSYDRDGLILTVKYCSPSKKGRLIFGEKADKALQPYGVYWRLGANEATSIEVNRDVTFGGKPLKAGKYHLYAYPGKEEWEIVLGKEWKVWGYEEPDSKNEVLRVRVKANNLAPMAENLLIAFDEDATLIIHWDQVELQVPIKIQ